MTADNLPVAAANVSQLYPVEGEPDACDVIVISGSITFVFHVSRVYFQRRKLESHVGVDWIPTNKALSRASFPEMPSTGFSPRNLDWRSNSSLDAYRRQLQTYYEPGGKTTFPWPQILEYAAQRVNEFIAMTGDLEVADYHETVTPNYFVRPIWPRHIRPTVWFGQGETCKGQMAVATAVGLCYGRNVASLASTELNRGIVYVDYEDDFDEFSILVSRAVNGLGVAVPPNLRRFDPKGRLFVDVAEQLKAKIKASGGADGVIIDSALPAVGGDAVDPQPVGEFFSAVKTLDIPPLIIAHETKAGNDEFPFGSQLWRTTPRMNVNFQASEEPKRDLDGNYVRDVLLRCTKANGVPRFQPLAFQFVFTDDEAHTGALLARPLASTWVRQIDPGLVSPELQQKLPLSRRLASYLRGGGGETAKEIADAIGADVKVIDTSLRRNPSLFRPEGAGPGRGKAQRWFLIQGGKDE